MTIIRFPVNVEICGVKIPKGEYVLKREWVDLTDEEIAEIPFLELVEGIQAKLKEKNGG